MPESITTAVLLPASPQRIYQAWLDGDEHGWMTGGAAGIDARPGGRYTAWDGYIQGVTLEMEPFSRIVQTWRAADFPPGAPDSRLEVRLEPAGDGTRLTLIHTDLPDATGDAYRQGWEEHYFKPMLAYFTSLGQP